MSVSRVMLDYMFKTMPKTKNLQIKMRCIFDKGIYLSFLKLVLLIGYSPFIFSCANGSPNQGDRDEGRSRLGQTEETKPEALAKTAYPKYAEDYSFQPIVFEDTINVNSLGIVGDGKTDMTDAINKAISSASKSRAALYFPKGKYIISKPGIILRNSNVGLIGAVDGNTIFAPGSKANNALLLSDAKRRDIQNIAIEHIVFQCNNGEFFSNFALLLFNGLNNVRIYDCRFESIYKNYIRFNDVSRISVLNSKFGNSGPIKRNSYFIIVREAKNIMISGNSFTGYYQAVNVIPSGEQSASDILVKENYFDGMWYLRQASLSGEGSSVTYTADYLKSEELDFIEVSNDFSNTSKDISKWRIVRILDPNSRGNASITDQSLHDDKASFLNDNIIPGEIVEFKSYRGVIDSVISDTELKIEYWYNKETLDRVRSQNGRFDYTIYKLYLGDATSYTPQKLHVKYFYDLKGKQVVPPNGSKFEMISVVPVYALLFSKNTSNVSIIDNKILRNYADQIGFYGSEALIANNYIRDGQDVGITITNLENKGSVIKSNYIERQGSCGIFVKGKDNAIENNTIMGPVPFVNFLDGSDNVMSGIKLVDGSNNVISNNIINLRDAGGIGGGIAISKGINTRNKIDSNTIRNVSKEKEVLSF